MTTKKATHITSRPLPAASGKAETAAKRDVSKLQKAIVDGLEDVKAQNLMVFDTEHLSSLFERVIVASGASNRQTKALAMSVREAVSKAGFPKPRTEGEDNGEWIIVDCGAAVVHIMQPAIRQYYHLEDIWGEKPLRLKHAASQKEVDKLQSANRAKETKPASAKKSALAGLNAAASAAAKPAQSTKLASKRVGAKKAGAPASPQSVARKTLATKVAAKKLAVKKVAAKKGAVKATPAAKVATKKSR